MSALLFPCPACGALAGTACVQLAPSESDRRGSADPRTASYRAGWKRELSFTHARRGRFWVKP